jgi:hypothetical protein
MRMTLLMLFLCASLSAQTTHADSAMGFDQTRTTHHFSLKPDGGLIQVEANDPPDAASRDAIRRHLRTIAREFSSGVFDKPLQTHGEMPPGVPALQRLKESIKYVYEEIERGGRVRITTADREALDAVHAFLRYQIKEHKSGT